MIEDPLVLMVERSRLQLVPDELWNQPEERFREVVMNYKDLLLSDNFVRLVRERTSNMVERDLDDLRRDDSSLEEKHAREQELLPAIPEYYQALCLA